MDLQFGWGFLILGTLVGVMIWAHFTLLRFSGIDLALPTSNTASFSKTPCLAPSNIFVPSTQEMQTTPVNTLPEGFWQAFLSTDNVIPPSATVNREEASGSLG